MFDPDLILVGLEIGTSKVCAAVGEVTENGELTILGFGQAKSRGVRKGEIIEAEKACEDVRNALVQAEEMAKVEIESLHLAVTGNHIRVVNNRGVHTIPSVDREITEQDVQDSLRNAKSNNCPAGYEIIDSVRQDFVVDDHAVYENPVGIVGARVEANVHVIQGSSNRIATSRRVVEGPTPMRVEKPVFSGLASALAVLTHEHKDMGAVVIDLGAGTTEFAFFHRGLLRHSGVLAVGGDHVTNDLIQGLRISPSLAEGLKLELGAAVVDPAMAGVLRSVSGTQGLPERRINVEQLQRIAALRVEETLELIARQLAAADALRLAGAGVFLCGGGARMSGIETLAGRIFRLPVHRGHAQNVSGPAHVLDNPEFATAIGLVRYAAMRSRQRPRRWSFPLLGAFTPRFGR